MEGIDLAEKQEKKEEDEKYKEKYTDAKLLKYISENKVKLSKEEEEYVERDAQEPGTGLPIEVCMFPDVSAGQVKN